MSNETTEVPERDIRKEAAAALKKVQAEKKPSTYMQVRVGYKHFILPHKAGLALIAAMEEAEAYEPSWSGPPTIKGVQKDTLEITLMSRQELETIKMAQLLKLPLEELERALRADPA